MFTATDGEQNSKRYGDCEEQCEEQMAAWRAHLIPEYSSLAALGMTLEKECVVAHVPPRDRARPVSFTSPEIVRRGKPLLYNSKNKAQPKSCA
jgi:hypothetical protein